MLTCVCDDSILNKSVTVFAGGQSSCAVNPQMCHANAQCVQATHGEHICTCEPGYAGDGYSRCDMLDDQTVPAPPPGGFHDTRHHGDG